MKRIELEVQTPAAALATFADTWQRAESNEPPTPRIAFGSLGELFGAITERRLELLRLVARTEGLNIRQLASHLERDYKNVHTDVTQLLELGLLERDARGHLSAPFDEIVIRAELRHAA